MNEAASMQTTPWYRQVWPWLLMSMPAAALVGGAITLWLALTSNNALVVDDYYREGKAINRELARDRLAERMQLGGRLQRDARGGAVLSLSSKAGEALPPFVTLKLVHATRSELDRTVTLAQEAPGRYVTGESRLPDAGRWHLVLEDPERRWRLVASTQGLSQAVQFGENPR